MVVRYNGKNKFKIKAGLLNLAMKVGLIFLIGIFCNI